MSSQTSEPAIRMLRHLARTGGTLMSKCIGCMDSVVLLSEVHPLATSGPYWAVDQAARWFGLVTPKELKQWKQRRGATFAQAIFTIDQRVRARGRVLVLRDWSHLDYLGAPYCTPAMKSLAMEELGGLGELAVCNTVRHPLDQWLSMHKFDQAGGGKMGFRFDAHMRSARVFGEQCAQSGMIRYEDFTSDPRRWVREMCKRLQVSYDDGWADNWAAYTTITGDRAGLGRAGGSAEVRAMPRRAFEPELLERARANDDYVRACEVMGYEV